MKTLLHHFAILLLASSAAAQTSDADALAFLKQHAPEIHTRISSLVTSDPADYRSALDEARTAAAEHSALVAAGDASAAAYLKMYVIDFNAISLADKIALASDEAEKSRLTVQLRQLIAASFEQWAIVEQARIRRLEKELTALKEKVQTALRDPDKVIAADTAQLIEECRSYQNTKGRKP